MKALRFLIAALFVSLILSFGSISAQEGEPKESKESSKLAVVWTSGDRDVALKMVFMYAFNSQRFGWWDEVTLIVWGPSAKLLSEDKELQDYILEKKDAGVILKACKACADMYEVSDKLTELGVDVKYMGGELTDFIKGDAHVITF